MKLLLLTIFLLIAAQCRAAATLKRLHIGLLTAETEPQVELDEPLLMHKSVDFFDIFKDNKHDWATYQGYDYSHTSIKQSQPELVGSSSLSWAQVDLMERQLSRYDWLVWLDMDTIVVDLTLQVENYIKLALEHRPQTSLIVEGSEGFKALQKGSIKSSVIILKNSAWSKKLLKNLKQTLADPNWSRRVVESTLDNALIYLLQSQHDQVDSHLYLTDLQDRWNQPLVYLPKVGILHFSGCHVGDSVCLNVFNGALLHILGHERMYIYQSAPYVQHIYNIFAGIYCIFALDRLYHILGRYFGPDRLASTPKSHLPETSDVNDVQYPMVAVQLPMFNETQCAETIIDAAAQLEWPLNRIFIQVVDDSTNYETRDVIDRRVHYWKHYGVNIEVRRRPHRHGFKAGAMNDAMDHFPADTQYIAIFDADFLPQPKFLLQTVPYLMANDNAAFVQTCWVYTNAKESLLTRMQEISLNFHFLCEQESRFRMRKFFNFNGTAGVWRLRAMVESGGWHTDTLVEDMDLSLRAYASGWDSIFLKDVKCLNEVPPTFEAYRGQQHRWTSGPMQVLSKAYIIIATSKHLSVFDKLFCLWFFLRNYVHIINFVYFLLLIPLMIWVPRITLYDWAVIYLPMAISISNVLFTPNECFRVMFYVLFENAMCLYKTGALICGVLNIGKAKMWIVTPKFARQKLVGPLSPPDLLIDEDVNQGPVHIIRASTPERCNDSGISSFSQSPQDSPILPMTKMSDSSLTELILDSPKICSIDMPQIYSGNSSPLSWGKKPPTSRLITLANAYKSLAPNIRLHRNELIMSTFLFACSYCAFMMRQGGIGSFCLLNAGAYLIIGLSYIGSR